MGGWRGKRKTKGRVSKKSMRKKVSESKIKKVFDLINFAYEKEVHYEDACKRLGISPPTLYRYLEDIKESELFDVKMDSMRNGNFKISAKRKLKYHLNEDEKLLLAIAVDLFEKVVPLPMKVSPNQKSYEKSLQRLKKAFFPYKGIEKILDENRIYISENPVSSSTSVTHFDHIKEAMRSGKFIKLSYKPAGLKPKEFTIFPLAFCYRKRAWYLWAYDVADRKKKFFRLNRIKDILSKHVDIEDKDIKKSEV